MLESMSEWYLINESFESIYLFTVAGDEEIGIDKGYGFFVGCDIAQNTGEHFVGGDVVGFAVRLVG